jgi:hypothetical protein
LQEGAENVFPQKIFQGNSSQNEIQHRRICQKEKIFKHAMLMRMIKEDPEYIELNKKNNADF